MNNIIAKVGIQVDDSGIRKLESDLTRLDSRIKGNNSNAFNNLATSSKNAAKSVKNDWDGVGNTISRGLGSANNSLKQSTVEFNQFGKSQKEVSASMRGVPAQITDIVVALQGGQRPMTVMLQQGGQLKDMFGGIGPAARALSTTLIGMINPFTIAAAGAAGVGYALWKMGEDSRNATTNIKLIASDISSIGSSGAFATTEGEIRRFLNVVSELNDVKIGKLSDAFKDINTSTLGLDGNLGKVAVNIAGMAEYSQEAADNYKKLLNQTLSNVEASGKLLYTSGYLTESDHERLQAAIAINDQLAASQIVAAALVDHSTDHLNNMQATSAALMTSEGIEKKIIRNNEQINALQLSGLHQTGAAVRALVEQNVELEKQLKIRRQIEGAQANTRTTSENNARIERENKLLEELNGIRSKYGTDQQKRDIEIAEATSKHNLKLLAAKSDKERSLITQARDEELSGINRTYNERASREAERASRESEGIRKRVEQEARADEQRAKRQKALMDEIEAYNNKFFEAASFNELGKDRNDIEFARNMAAIHVATAGSDTAIRYSLEIRGIDDTLEAVSAVEKLGFVLKRLHNERDENGIFVIKPEFDYSQIIKDAESFRERIKELGIDFDLQVDPANLDNIVDTVMSLNRQLSSTAHVNKAIVQEISTINELYSQSHVNIRAIEAIRNGTLRTTEQITKFMNDEVYLERLKTQAARDGMVIDEERFLKAREHRDQTLKDFGEEQKRIVEFERMSADIGGMLTDSIMNGLDQGRLDFKSFLYDLSQYLLRSNLNKIFASLFEIGQGSSGNGWSGIITSIISAFASRGTTTGVTTINNGSNMGNWAYKGAYGDGHGNWTFMSNGGILNRRTQFATNDGHAVAGEAGAEGVLPLTRTANGKLGVHAVGDGGNNSNSVGITQNNVFNVTIANSENPQRDDQEAARIFTGLAKQIFREQMAQEMRPGGMLAKSVQRYA